MNSTEVCNITELIDQIKEIKSKNGNSIEVKVPVNFDYSAYDIINMFAKDKELTTLCFNFLNKLSPMPRVVTKALIIIKTSNTNAIDNSSL